MLTAARRRRLDLGLVFLGCHRRGGVERLVYEAARHFSGEHDVTVYACSFESTGLEGISKVRIDLGPRTPRLLRLADFSRRVRQEVHTHSHDHLISFGVAPVGADVLWVNSVHAAWLERRDRVPGDRIRSSPLRRYLPRHQGMLAMERRYFTRSQARLALVVSDKVAADLERLYGFPRQRSVIVPNGYDSGEFAPGIAAEGRAAVRDELGIPQEAVVLLLVANELSRKGFSVLLEAVAALGDPRVHVLLVGRAAPSPYSEKIRALGLADRFRYGGSRTDMGRVHGAADIFVLPTRYEAFSLAVVEALASGLPVITTNVPGARDLVIDHCNGRLQQDPTSSEELTLLIRDALNDHRYRKWATGAAGSVRDHTWPKLLDRALDAMLRTS
jgi:UDP-glucose:(heptosyl)LPS alpha-1,3-glucosyltransferase